MTDSVVIYYTEDKYLPTKWLLRKKKEEIREEESQELKFQKTSCWRIKYEIPLNDAIEKV